MLSSAARPLVGRTSTPPQQTRGTGVPVAPALTDRAAESPARSLWPAARLALTDQLWGPGFILPGGETEILRLARPLGVSPAASLLLVGGGSGGPASAVARNLGASVTALETDQSLLAASTALIGRAKLGKKVRIEQWDRDHPLFPAKTHHHCLALEPLLGAKPEPILDGLARALKPAGHLAMTELTAEAPLNQADLIVRRWSTLEQRDPSALLASVAVTRMLGRVGFDVRIAEDISQRHMEHADLGWRVVMRDLHDTKPSREDAAELVREAELWMLRRRLVQQGRLRMMRWHAISPAFGI